MLPRGLQFVVLAVASVLACRPGVAWAQMPWPKLQYGMSAAEVTRVVPGAALVKGEEKAPRRVLAKLEGYSYAGKVFDADFIFDDDRLVQVHLADTVFMEDNASVTQSFERLVAALRKLYGTESTHQVESRPAGLFGEARWPQEGSEVVVSISPVTQNQSMILFNFFQRK